MWKGREDLRSLNVCSIDPPGNILVFGAKSARTDLFSQDVKTLTMRYMPGRWTTGMWNVVSVSKSCLHRSYEIDLPQDIADVSHFVHASTAMDREAASRGTTVYLVDKRIDMLPSLLGTPFHYHLSIRHCSFLFIC